MSTHSRVMSEPYSKYSGNKDWAFKVVDLHIFINRPECSLPLLKQLLLENSKYLEGLVVSLVTLVYNCTIKSEKNQSFQVGPFDKHGMCVKE